MDQNKPVDASSDYTTPDGEVLRISGARDLAEHAATNPNARMGFIRQLFHHVVKQPPAAYATDTLDRLDAEFAGSGYHMRELYVAIAVTSAAHGLNPQAN
jgi:hypothetical protein